MDVIERWTLRVCDNCGQATTPDCCPNDRDGIHIFAAARFVDVVPADAYRGAVEALREIDKVCSFGADREGMTAMGVREVRRIAQHGLGGR